MDNLKPLFDYLDSENIKIDKKEFEYQFNSHPNYPTLLAISDTLSFFEIRNASYKIDVNDIDLLPDKFMALLKDNHNDYFSFIIKKNGIFNYTNYKGKNESSACNNFSEIWGNVALLVDKTENHSPKKTRQFSSHIYLFFGLVSVIVLSITNFRNLWSILFYIFPALGILFSVVALKDLFNTKSEFFNKFCNVGIKTSCNSVINSKKWKIFEIVTFSDLSIIFFSFQIFALIIMGLADLKIEYFSIQMILLFCSLPVLFVSFYYQKFIEKKWCPVCLAIICVILVEIGYMYIFRDFLSNDIQISGKALLLSSITFALTTSIWSLFKRNKEKFNKLKELEFQSNRFKRNYQIFRSLMVKGGQYDLPLGLFEFGDPNAKIHIGIVTSPFCGYCEGPNYLLNRILQNYSRDVKVSVYYNVNGKNARLRQFALIMNQLEFGATGKGFFAIMDNWYSDKDFERWKKNYMVPYNSDQKFENRLVEHNHWFSLHHFNFTPCLLINGYKYPKEYQLNEIIYFVDELIHDEELLPIINNDKILNCPIHS